MDYDPLRHGESAADGAAREERVQFAGGPNVDTGASGSAARSEAPAGEDVAAPLPVVAASVERLVVEAGLAAMVQLMRPGSRPVREDELRRLAVEVGLDKATSRRNVFRRAVHGMGFGGLVLAEGWLERLRGLLALAINVLGRVPNTLDEFKAVRRVRDLMGEVAQVEPDRVSVDEFDVLVARLRSGFTGVVTPGDRARVVDYARRAKIGQNFTWRLNVSDIRHVHLIRTGKRADYLHQSMQVLANGVLWIRDPAVPAVDAAQRAARTRVEGGPADPSRSTLAVYGYAGGDVRPTGVSWDGQELWPDELFELLRRDDGTWRAQDGMRLQLYGNDDEERRQRFLTAIARQFQADGMRVVPPRWPEVSLHGEMVVWVDDVLVRAPAGSVFAVHAERVGAVPEGRYAARRATEE